MIYILGFSNMMFGLYFEVISVTWQCDECVGIAKCCGAKFWKLSSDCSIVASQSELK